jgi:hypothetical protein
LAAQAYAAWIDCLISVDEPEGGMVADEVVVSDGDVLTLELDDAAAFASRCPEQYAALVDCASSVNWSRKKVMGAGQSSRSRSPSTHRSDA